MRKPREPRYPIYFVDSGELVGYAYRRPAGWTHPEIAGVYNPRTHECQTCANLLQSEHEPWSGLCIGTNMQAMLSAVYRQENY